MRMAKPSRAAITIIPVKWTRTNFRKLTWWLVIQRWYVKGCKAEKANHSNAAFSNSVNWKSVLEEKWSLANIVYTCLTSRCLLVKLLLSCKYVLFWNKETQRHNIVLEFSRVYLHSAVRDFFGHLVAAEASWYDRLVQLHISISRNHRAALVESCSPDEFKSNTPSFYSPFSSPPTSDGDIRLFNC